MPANIEVKIVFWVDGIRFETTEAADGYIFEKFAEAQRKLSEMKIGLEVAG